MPALFAYLIAVGLLLGGGYGALSWLAAPEPVKVAAKAKPKPSSGYEASSQTSSLMGDNTNQVPSGSKEHPLSAASALNAAGDESANVISGSADAPQIGSARAEAASDQIERHIDAAPAEVRQEGRRPAASPPNNQQTAASTAPAAVARPMKRPHVRPASNQPVKPTERRALALMILRTIEFPDGRRVTRLIPYHGRERSLAYEADE